MRVEESMVFVLHAGHGRVADAIRRAGDETLLVEIQGTYSKAMVIAAGNWFERRVGLLLKEFARACTDGDERMVTLVHRRVFARQFHTMFNWKDGTWTEFLASFGSEFRAQVGGAMKERGDLLAGAQAFMALGAERNLLAHDQNIDLGPQYTVDEVREKFVAGAAWLEWLQGELIRKPQQAAQPPHAGVG